MIFQVNVNQYANLNLACGVYSSLSFTTIVPQHSLNLLIFVSLKTPNILKIYQQKENWEFCITHYRLPVSLSYLPSPKSVTKHTKINKHEELVISSALPCLVFRKKIFFNSKIGLFGKKVF